MSMPIPRALRRTPLITAIVAIALSAGGVAAARLATDDGAPRPVHIARAIDTAQANAPPPRAIGLTADYFETLGIVTREAPVEKVKKVEPPPADCASHPSSQLAKSAAPDARNAPDDSSQLTTARVPRKLTRSPVARVAPTIALPSE